METRIDRDFLNTERERVHLYQRGTCHGVAEVANWQERGLTQKMQQMEMRQKNALHCLVICFFLSFRGR